MRCRRQKNLKKIYVLDTSVLLHDPRSIFSFEDNQVVIPAVVIEEVDGKKHNQDELGRNARMISRILDSLRQYGHLHNAIPLENGGSLTVELNHRSIDALQSRFPEINNDNRILAVALNLFTEEQQKEKPQPVILVSKDTIMRIKADALGITAEDYLSDQIRCNSISPARVHTPFVDGFLQKNYPNNVEEMFEKPSKTQPIGRMGLPIEIATLALYLCSEEAAFVTGCDYPMDGGFTTLNN